MKHEMRVYIEDTDAGGIVYYVNYLKFMERARTEYLRQFGFGKTAMWDESMFVVHSLTIDYKKPAQLDDWLIVTAYPKKIGRAGMVFEQKICREDELLCEAEIKIACVDAKSMRPTKLPDELVECMNEKEG